MVKHTRGPWKFGKRFNIGNREFLTLETADGKSIIAHISIPIPNPNALLISAAPEILDACKAALSYLTFSPAENYQLRELLESVIRKATGEE